jgi:cytochrome o ubiquinol oxidase subunit II
MTIANVDGFERRARSAIRRHWVLFLIPGVVMAVLGLIAAAAPLIATPVMETFAGWLFLTGVFIGLAALLTTRDVPGRSRRGGLRLVSSLTAKSRLQPSEVSARHFSVVDSCKGWPRVVAALLTAFAARCGALLAPLALTGCEPGILPSQGPVGKGDTTILIDSLAIMLAIVIPTIAATLAFAWWFRSSNSSARHRPDFIYSGQIEMVTWSIPLMTIMLLGGVAWIGSHQLDPARPLPSNEAPLKVQVVSLDWKWLFIYPDHNIATVNHLVIPAGAPVHFTLTSSSVMNAFFIPQLGSMIYTMNRMTTQLHLKADQPGTFLGMSSHFSGDGFADMQFKVEALPKDGFSAWIDETRKAATATFTSQTYQDLAKQSMNVAPFAYSAVEPDLFGKVVKQSLPPGPGPVVETSPGASKRGKK